MATARPSIPLAIDEFRTPFGACAVAHQNDIILSIQLGDDATKKVMTSMPNRSSVQCRPCWSVREAIARYTVSDATAFSSLEWKLVFGTEFQRKVWHALTKITVGSLLSYADLAKWVGQPEAYQAVGQAVGENPLMLLLPCHRVIGSHGKLTGFSAGVQIKQLLLQHEGWTVEGACVKGWPSKPVRKPRRSQ